MAAIALGLPVVPGSDGADQQTTRRRMDLADGIGYPVLIKAAAGGGGKGMKVANARAEMAEALKPAREPRPRRTSATTPSISRSTSSTPGISRSRSWATAMAMSIHLGERDCSLQRRHQKVLGGGALARAQCRRSGERSRDSVTAMKKLGYRSAGTIEFLLTRTGSSTSSR